MESEDSLSACCAFCLCSEKHDKPKQLILEKFYSEFINNPTFNQLKVKKNGESGEDKPVDNWTICGECGSHVNRLMGSKAKVDKVEMEVRRLQRRVVEEMKVLLEEVDGMCGEMIVIEGILSNRNINSDVASGRGMRSKCKEFKDRVINILRDLKNFHQGVGTKLVSSDVPIVNVKKAIKKKVSTLKSSKYTKRKSKYTKGKSKYTKGKNNLVVRSKSQPPSKRISPPVTVTTKPETEKEEEISTEVKLEAEPIQDDDNDRDCWHWNGGIDDNNGDDGPQLPPERPQQNVSSLSTQLLPKGIMAMLIAKSKKKRKRTTHLHYPKKRKNAIPRIRTKNAPSIKKSKLTTYENENEDYDGWPGGNGEEINDDDGAPNSQATTDVPVCKEPSNVQTVDPGDEDDDKNEISSSESDTSDEDFDPENKALIEYRGIKISRTSSTFRKNFIVRINQKSTIATSNTMPSEPTDDPRRPFRFFWSRSKNKFYVDNIEIYFLDHLEDNPNGDKYGLRCSLCEYTVYPSGIMAKPRENIEDSMFDHVLGKHLKAYRCNQCEEDKFLADIGRWREHRRSHAMEFACDICERPLSSTISLKNHRWTHLSQEEKEDPSNQELKPEHLKKPIAGKDFICEVCGKGFREKRTLKDHKEIHKSSEEREKIICESCGKTVLKAAYRSHRNKWCKPPREVICHICGGGVKNTRELNAHLIKLHPNEKTYECDVCGSKFKTKPQMRSHKEIHTKERKHLCNFCGRGFKQRKNCNRHEKTCGGGRSEQVGPSRERGPEVEHKMEPQGQQPSTSYQQAVWNPF